MNGAHTLGNGEAAVSTRRHTCKARRSGWSSASACERCYMACRRHYSQKLRQCRTWTSPTSAVRIAPSSRGTANTRSATHSRVDSGIHQDDDVTIRVCPLHAYTPPFRTFVHSPSLTFSSTMVARTCAAVASIWLAQHSLTMIVEPAKQGDVKTHHRTGPRVT